MANLPLSRFSSSVSAILVLLLALVTALSPARAQLTAFYQWQNPRPTGATISDIAALNDSTAFALQRFDNTGLRTTDRGRTWTRISLGSAIGDVWAERVSFAGDSVGLVGQNRPEDVPFGQQPRTGASLMRTINGGRTWQVVSGVLPIGSAIIDLQLVTRQVGYLLYVTSVGSYLKRTIDGGQTWGAALGMATVPGFFGRVTDLCFVSATTGWVAAGSGLAFNEGSLLMTTDGGLSWQRRTLDGDSTVVHQQVVFADAQHGWLLTNAPFTTGAGQYRTTDGGRSWRPMPTQGTIDFLAAGSAQRVAAYGQYSIDGGLNWQGSTGSHSERFVLRASGVGFGTTGPEYTADFGATWTGYRSVFAANNTQITKLVAFDARRAWAGADLQVARTMDRGRHWRDCNLPGWLIDSLGWSFTGADYAWAFPDPDTAYIAVNHSTAAAPQRFQTDVVGTTDGGRTWHAQPLPPHTPPLRALAFFGRHGCGVGDSGVIVVTHDAGRSWQRSRNDSTRQLTAVAWASPALLLACGYRSLLRSTDGGQSWTAQPVTTVTFDISWRTPTEVWLTGAIEDGTGQVTFQRSRDGGLTWSPVVPAPSPPITTNKAIRARFDVGGVTFADSLHGWYRDTRPIYTSDGGQSWQALNGSYALPAGSTYVDRYNGWFYGGGQTRPDGILHYSEKFVQADTSLARLRYCAGDTLLLAYGLTGNFGSAEQAMVAELSDAQGRFGRYPLVVGQGTASPLQIVLPPTLPTGTRYLMRVSRADHSVIGGDNQRDVTIWDRPAAVAVAPADSARFCQGDSVLLTAPAGFAAYHWTSGDTTATLWVTQANTYAVQVASGGRCFGPLSPPVTVRVTPTPAVPTFTSQPQTSGIVVLTSTSPTGNQWFFNGQPIPGATAATYSVTTATQSGAYSLQVTQRGCASPLSPPQTITVTSTAEEMTSSILELRPNPAGAAVSVLLSGSVQFAQLQLTDLTGRSVLSMIPTQSTSELLLPLTEVPAGTYMLCVVATDRHRFTRRLVVNH